MKDRQCELIRRELDELPLNEDLSAAAAEHLQSCAACREFRRQQTKLRQIVGSLGTVNAPPDFDFRLRARLAADSQPSGTRYWSFAVKGLATAAILVVVGVGGAVVWQRGHQPVTVAEGPGVHTQEVGETPPPPPTAAPKVTPVVVFNNEPRHKPQPPLVIKPKRTLTSADFSSEGANVVSNTRPALNKSTVFPIEASLQSVKVSLDDGRGNARTISFPPVSFGSQRVLTTANQFAPKGNW
jgi:hypothetical protein